MTGADDLGLRAQQPVADRDADVQRPAGRVHREAPFAGRHPARLALQGGEIRRSTRGACGAAGVRATYSVLSSSGSFR